MNVHTLAGYLDSLEKVTSRNAITETLAELFKKLSNDEIDKAVYMMLGGLAPQYKNIVFGVADKMLERAILKAYDVSYEEVKESYKKTGDIGLTAENYAKSGPSTMTVSLLYKNLLEVAEYTGDGSIDKKIDKLARILSNLDPLSARFIARIPVGKLRLGFSDKTILDALSWMSVGNKSKTPFLEKAYQVLPDVGKLAREVKVNGIEDAVKNVTPVIGIPIMPMLPQRLKSPAEMVKKMGRVSVEPKFDGLRAQIHFKKGSRPRAFTRNLNEISEMFPELSKLEKYLTANSVILDSEAIGVDEKTKRFADFQTTMNRRRKHNIEESAKSIPLRFQIFDVMYRNGKNLMNEPYSERRKVLEKLFKKNDIFVLDETLFTEDPLEIKGKHHELVSRGLEGVIVKNIASRYVPGRTGWRWVKMKEAEEAEGKLADTVDAVIMGYTRGRGKRASFGVGQFLAGVRSGEKILSITKVGTGLTDSQFKELNERLQKITSNEKPKDYEVHKDLEPDYWVLPEIVVELAADELTKSPKHTAGLALRFPRLVKFRDDKSSRQATTLEEIKKLYKLQKK